MVVEVGKAQDQFMVGGWHAQGPNYDSHADGTGLPGVEEHIRVFAAAQVRLGEPHLTIYLEHLNQNPQRLPWAPPQKRLARSLDLGLGRGLGHRQWPQGPQFPLPAGLPPGQSDLCLG